MCQFLLILALRTPLFSGATVNEGEVLTIICVSRNIPDITTFQILDPNRMPVPTVAGVFSVPNVTRAFAGTYTCVVRSTLDNTTMNMTSVVVVQCKLFIKPLLRTLTPSCMCTNNCFLNISLQHCVIRI